MRDLIEFRVNDEQKQVVDASQAERVKAILERDFDEFKNIRAFALKHMSYLKGKSVPIEVTSIQSLPSHNCLIINDLLLLSYTEAVEFIYDLKKKEQENERRATSPTISE